MTVFLIIWLRRQSRGKVAPGLGLRGQLDKPKLVKIGQNWVLFIGLRWIPSRTEYPRVQSLPPVMGNFLSISIRVLAAKMQKSGKQQNLYNYENISSIML